MVGIGLCALRMSTHLDYGAHTRIWKLLTKYNMCVRVCVYAVMLMWCQLERNFKLSIEKSVLLELLSLEWARPLKLIQNTHSNIHLCIWKKEEAEEMLLLLCVQSIYLNAHKTKHKNNPSHLIPSHSSAFAFNNHKSSSILLWMCAHRRRRWRRLRTYFSNRKIYARPHVKPNRKSFFYDFSFIW